MGAKLILIMMLLAAVTAEEDSVVLKRLFNIDIKSDPEIDLNAENQNEEIPDEEDLSKTIKLVVFKPYVPEFDESITENVQSNSDTEHPKLERSINSFDTEDSNGDVEILDEGQYKDIDVTSRPSARYEITENVIDIPDDRTPAGPIVANYTPYRNTPLNLGTPTNITEVKNEIGDEDKNHSKSRLSILHIKAEFGDQPKQNKITKFFKGVKQYITGIKTDVVNGIQQLFRKGDKPDSKERNISKEIDDEFESVEEDGDDFAELHQTIHRGFT